MLDDRPGDREPRGALKLANWAVKASGLKYTSMRAISALSQRRAPGTGELDRQAGRRLDDPGRRDLRARPAGRRRRAERAEDAEAAGKFQAMLLRAPGTRVEGGTDEIMRNIIAERVLGLPGDIRVDKDVPFNKIPTRRSAPRSGEGSRDPTESILNR